MAWEVPCWLLVLIRAGGDDDVSVGLVLAVLICEVAELDAASWKGFLKIIILCLKWFGRKLVSKSSKMARKGQFCCQFLFVMQCPYPENECP